MTYSGPPRLGKFKTRLSLFKKRCQLLQAMPHDVHTKSHLARTAILPTLYGVALLPLGEAHVVQMRSQLANATLGFNHSRNSTLAVQFLPHLLDPAIWIILQAIEAARRFLLQSTPGDQQMFLKVLSKHNGCSNTCKGPASCLKHYILRLGWTVTPDGLVHVSAFVSLSLLTTSKQAWQYWALQSWQQDIMHFTDRKALQGARAINLIDTRAVLKKLPPGHFSRIIQEISGAFQIASQKQKWDATASADCPFCTNIDSRAHRVYDCPATTHIRAQHQDIVDFYRFQSDLIHELPVLFVDPKQELIQTIHWTQPVASFDPSLVEQVVQLCELGVTPCFYTDGSCQLPTVPTTSFAAFSVVLDLCSADTERETAVWGYKTTGILPNSLRPILASRTQGPQKIARSELFAVVLLVETFPAADIYSDSQTTIDRFLACQANRDPLIWINSDDMDLLLRLQTAVTVKHRILKVAAHQDPMLTTNLLTCYHQLGNMVADLSAVRACSGLHPWLVKECVAFGTELQLQRQSLTKWYSLLLELQTHCAKLMTTMEQSSQELTTVLQQQSNFQRMQQWSIDAPWQPETVRLSMLEECSWGRHIATATLQWMNLVVWPQQTTDDCFGVTWLELVLSFCLFSGIYLPIPRNGSDGKQRLIFCHSWDELQLYQVKYSDLANYFSILVSQVEKLVFPKRWPSARRGLVKSAYVLGSSTHSAGYTCRPCFPHSQTVIETLKQHFKSDTSTTHAEIPKLDLSPMWESDVVEASILGLWQKRSLKSQSKMREFQQRIQVEKSSGMKQQRLSFGSTR